ncbi:MAG: ATP-binding cassette domain-containing protein [Saprospiraceae bacterium]|nr:ATP-binding cassette domain-containing protein [Saprospiraceae bacterium]MDW8484541.1 ATP-binding cassette domain-containing protein [Saprospiraceae bacterium]
MTPLQRVVRLLSKYRRELRFIVLYAITSGLINLSLPLGIQAIIGLIAGGAISVSWALLVGVVALGAVFVGILKLMQLSILEHMQRQIFTDAALEFAVRIPRLNLEMLRKEYVPELINRFFDTMAIQKGLPKIILEGTTAILQILFSLILLSFYHSTFVLSSLLLLGVLGLLFWWTVPLGMKASLEQSKYKYKLAHWLEEVGRVSSTFKLAGEIRFPIDRTDDLTVKYLEAREKLWRILLLQFSTSVVFRVLVLGGYLILGSILVMDNQINIGQFVAAEILVIFIVESVEKLILLHETGYDVLTATEKIGQVADLPIEREDGIRVEEFCDNHQPFRVELRNLSYKYDDSPEPVLKSINLDIKPGERVAITGYPGAGKSTLMDILSVSKRDFSGMLLFNGLPKQNINLRSLREHIGDYSSQEDIFRGSILENITLGRSEVPTQEVLKLADKVGLMEFIRKSPQGLNTELLPGGQNIPRSTITKLLIARAIITEPNLLVMEEPLGNLTFRDRLRIGRLLVDRRNRWTFICATADPLLASLCDRVIVLREGQIIMDTTYDEVERSEHFERIFRSKSEMAEDYD